MDEMQDFAIAQTNLTRFCNKEDIEIPELLYLHKDDVQEKPEEIVWFTPELLSEKAVMQNERVKKNGEMVRRIQQDMEKIVTNPEVVEFYTQEDVRMNRYFYNKALQKSLAIRTSTLAVLDDRARSDCDLMFTTSGIMPVIRGHVKKTIPYQEITWSGNTRKKELRIGSRFSSDNLDMDALYELIQALAEL